VKNTLAYNTAVSKTEQFALLLKNILQNKQTLHLFTRILKQKAFTKVILNSKLEGLGKQA
jgi:hypothetical protein